MRNDQKQKYRNFGILSVASALVIGGTVLAENYTGSKETASSTINKTETVYSNSTSKSSSSTIEKSSSSKEQSSDERMDEETQSSTNQVEVEFVKASASTSNQDQVEVTPLVASTESYTYEAPVTVPVAQQATTASGSVVLANGNTAGEHGVYAAARMAELTGVSASTWENIIARESNGDIYAANASGASGLFQTMPGWGSTASVEDQIQAAYNAYSNQGLAAWGY